MISGKDLRNTILLGLLVLVLLLLPRLSFPIGASSSTLLISEVFYDTPGTDEDEEWIEIYNPTASAIDLSVYKIGDEEEEGKGEGMYQFPPEASTPSGGVIVIALKATGFHALYGFNPDYEVTDTDPSVPDMIKYSTWATGKIALSNSGDEVLILNGGDALVDAMSYGDKTTYFNPPCPDVAAGHSLERSPANVDTDTAADWIDQEFPKPGSVTIPIYKVYLPFVVRIISEGFCGWSTYGECSSDSDCILDGCSAQVCQSKYEEPVATTCEWRDCYNAKMYGLKCRCIDGRCQWSK